MRFALNAIGSATRVSAAKKRLISRRSWLRSFIGAMILAELLARWHALGVRLGLARSVAAVTG
jgi:hypothetical protein